MSLPCLETLLAEPVHGAGRGDKEPKLLAAVREVAGHHYQHCAPYRTLCDKRGFDPAGLERLEELPYLPTSFFKRTLLRSVPEDQVFREITSSATTSGQPSRMALDRETSRRQSKCFNRVLLERIGSQRYNFIVLDEPSTVGRSQVVSARASTIRSLLFCARKVDTCVELEDGALSLNQEKLDRLLEEAQEGGDPLMLFGFTFILYAHVVRPLLEAGRSYRLPGAKILHIGGWKKLESQKVTPEKLVEDCRRVFGVHPGDVVDLYGFTEQAGLLYPTCPEGRRHVPVWGQVIARDPVSLEPLEPGREGLLQFITPIQTSYPGHSVLTEDVGLVLGEDDCPCGRPGRTFKVVGRAPQSEVRGCGDIMAEKFA
jgi:hypothetical protein